MRFDPYSFDTKYSDAMLNFLSGQVGEEMSSKRDIEKTLMLEKLKQDLKKKTLQENLVALKEAGLFGNMTGGGAGESYRTGLNTQGDAPMYLKGLSDEMLPEYAVRTPEEQRASSFQNRLGAYMTAKNIQKPDVSLVGQPKDVIRRSLLARGIERSLAPEFKGRKFIQGESGAFKESDIRNEKNQSLARANLLRREFIDRPEIKEFTAIKSKVSSMNALKNQIKGVNSNLAIDQGLITLFNKVTDPNSVVRESEYERTPENLSLANRFKGAFEKWKKGGAGLTNDDRDAIIFGAKVILNNYGEIYNDTLGRYEAIAISYDVDPSLITAGTKPYEPYDLSKNNTEEKLDILNLDNIFEGL